MSSWMAVVAAVVLLLLLLILLLFYFFCNIHIHISVISPDTTAGMLGSGKITRAWSLLPGSQNVVWSHAASREACRLDGLPRKEQHGACPSCLDVDGSLSYLEEALCGLSGFSRKETLGACRRSQLSLVTDC